MMLVVALFLTAVPTSAFARQFRAADTKSEGYPTVQALRYTGRLVAERNVPAMPFLFRTDFGRKPFEAAVAGIHAKAQRDPAIARSTERIRKVE
jgi:hypothetical protein